MSKGEIVSFLMSETQIAKVSTVNKDGTFHVIPVWFVADGDDIIFTTEKNTSKGNHLQRDNRMTICVDDQAPPYSYVMIYGNAKLSELQQNELLKLTTQIASRYMSKESAGRYGARNAVEGELLVRVKPARVIGKKNISDF